MWHCNGKHYEAVDALVTPKSHNSLNGREADLPAASSQTAITDFTLETISPAEPADTVAARRSLRFIAYTRRSVSKTNPQTACGRSVYSDVIDWKKKTSNKNR